MVKTTILLSEEQHEFLRDLSHHNRKSISDIVRVLVDQSMGIGVPDKVNRIGTITRGSKKDTPSTDVTVLERDPVDPNIQPAWRPSEEQFHKCDATSCKSMEAKLVRGTGYSDEGEVTVEKYLCEKHIKIARKSGEEVTVI